MLSELAQRDLLELLFITPDGDERRVFSIVDGAMMKENFDQLEDYEADYECLFRGETDPMVLTRAPFLVEITRDTPLAQWLVVEGWGRHWGIFALAPKELAFDDVLDHLRELLEVRLPDDRVVFFRFYDPRVWEPFFETCDSEQLQALLGPLHGFACESSDGKTLFICEAEDGKARRIPHPLTA